MFEGSDDLLVEVGMSESEKKLGEAGRIFVRASGTEPVIRVMLEGKDGKLLRNLEEDFIQLIGEELN